MAFYDRLRGLQNECEGANIVLKIIDSGVWLRANEELDVVEAG